MKIASTKCGGNLTGWQFPAQGKRLLMLDNLARQKGALIGLIKMPCRRLEITQLPHDFARYVLVARPVSVPRRFLESQIQFLSSQHQPAIALRLYHFGIGIGS